MTRLLRVIRQQRRKTLAARLGRLGVRDMAHVVIMAHGARLLTPALDADEYLVVQV